jgi:hypothetical protein
MMRRLTLTLALLAITAPTLAAQETSSLAGVHRSRDAEIALIDQRLGSRFPESVALRIHSIVDSASREGLPVEPLVLRALEGGAKGVPADAIYTALTRLRASLRLAAQALGLGTPPTDLTTAAAALQTGLAPGQLIALRTARGEAPITVPLGAYLDLTARGAVPARAWDRVMDLARDGADDRAYQDIDPADLVARRPEDRR